MFVDKGLEHTKPDITIVGSVTQIAQIINIAVPYSINVIDKMDVVSLDILMFYFIHQALNVRSKWFLINLLVYFLFILLYLFGVWGY